MTNLIVELSKYALIILIALYTFLCFSVLKKKNPEEMNAGFKSQIFLIFLIHLLSYAVLYLKTEQIRILLLYLAEVIVLQAVLVLTQVIYPKINRLVLNNMCLLLTVGFVILTRLNYDKAVRQLQIAAAALAISLILPVVIRKLTILKDGAWFYGILGLLLLILVAGIGKTSYGAKLSLTIAGITLQPSEFVKITFVFFIASRLAKSTLFKDVVITTIVAALHVIILVLSRDLGGALIFFIAYLIVLYVATKKAGYLLGGLGAGCAAAMIAYQLFSHVQIRVLAWKDPFSVIDKEGYQITQSLFAIGTGGWFGMGLYQGMPYKIPVVEQDFAFSAIAEELGGIFAVCLILICVSCFIMFVNIAMQIKNSFYKYTALGLGVVYIFQVFLTIGGAVKFVPSTGVTLPLVSYGGSSLVATVMMFAIIQGMYLLKEDEELKIEHERKQAARKAAKTKAKRDKTKARSGA